jgi:DNA-binding transcriptional MerR regulator
MFKHLGAYTMFTEEDLLLLLEDIAAYRMQGYTYHQVAAALGENVTDLAVRRVIRLHRAEYNKAKRRARQELLDELFAESLRVMRSALHDDDGKTRARAAETLLRIHHQQTKADKPRTRRPKKETPPVAPPVYPVNTVNTADDVPLDPETPEADELEPLPDGDPLPDARNARPTAHTQRPVPAPQPTTAPVSPPPRPTLFVDPHRRE